MLRPTSQTLEKMIGNFMGENGGPTTSGEVVYPKVNAWQKIAENFGEEGPEDGDDFPPVHPGGASTGENDGRFEDAEERRLAA